MLSNKEIYRQLCERESIPLMAQDRWMDAVSYGKDWDAVIVWRDENGAHCVDNVAAALPCHLYKKYGIRFMLMPQLTQTSAIYVNPSVESASITSLVADKLEEYLHDNHICYCLLQGYFEKDFIESAQNLGYRISERHSYRIENKTDYNSLIAAYDSNRKRNLKKAHDLCLSAIDIEEFYAFHKECLAERGLEISYQYELLRRIQEALSPTSQIEVYGAKDLSGHLFAAVVLVSDTRIAYYLLPTYSQSSRNRGAMTWLTTQLIMMVNGRGQVFDFEGSMVPSIALAYKSYGSVPVNYFRIEKYRSSVVKLLVYLRNRLNRIKI